MGNEFMRNMEGYAARIPTMPCVGNHGEFRAHSRARRIQTAPCITPTKNTMRPPTESHNNYSQ